MIVGIEGKITYKQSNILHIKTNHGLTYQVIVSLNTLSKIIDDEISLFISQITRDDGVFLYGFLNHDEKNMFERLIKVNGIGAVSAIATCSTLSTKEFQKALIAQDIEAFKRVPGIGVKTAKRVLIELSDFNLNLSEIPNFHHEAQLALESLGFKKEKVSQVLLKCESKDTTSLIKEALQKLK